MIKTTSAKILRLIQLGLTVGGRSAAEMCRRKGTLLEIRLDRLHEGLAIAPPDNVPIASIDLAATDPVAAMVSNPDFLETIRYFENSPAAVRSLVSPPAQALLFTIIRNQRPAHVFEIGTYKAGTAEAICRALHANGSGMLHTVDPFRGDYLKAMLKHWPGELLDYISLYPMDSMDFYKDMERRQIAPDLVFVDGNHEYEFAQFDIGCAARYLRRDGFIVVDNIAQPGPFFAARDFVNANPGWREHGTALQSFDTTKSFDRERRSIIDTDFLVLRAPHNYIVDGRPWNVNRIRQRSNTVSGLNLQVATDSGASTLDVQVVLRGFGAVPVEVVGEATVAFVAQPGVQSIRFTTPLIAEGQFAYFTVEPWLIWRGNRPLELARLPEPL
jgi:predicted O-methyltransferase YrrM